MSGPRVKPGAAEPELTRDGADPAGGPVLPDRRPGPAEGSGDGSRAYDAGTVDSADEERELLEAIQRYQCTSRRMFPTWSEILQIMQELGYRKPG